MTRSDTDRNHPPASIAFGTAGWSYPDWEGIVYRGAKTDRLRFLAGYLDMIEIDSFFYRPPNERVTASWAERVADRPAFFFAAKVPRAFTHENRFSEHDAAAFVQGFRPLIDAGRLRYWLAQFRYDVRDTPAARTLMKRLTASLRDSARVVVEVRHRDWQQPEGLGFLRDLGVIPAHLDYPVGRDGFDADDCGVGDEGYLRLHGRNAAAWFDRKAGRDETYNYLYNAQELDTLRDRVLRLARTRRSMTVVANNHYAGKAVANALELKSEVSGQKVRVPSGVLLHYPGLKRVAETESERKDVEREPGCLF